MRQTTPDQQAVQDLQAVYNPNLSPHQRLAAANRVLAILRPFVAKQGGP